MNKSTFLLSALLSLFACKKDTTVDLTPSSSSALINLPANYFNYANPDLPVYYQNGPVAQAENTPANNGVSDAGATLGRVLFYDKNLSANNTISCASCHQNSNGFSDQAILSNGFNNGLTGRHSMSLANSRYYANRRFFWDERAQSLEEQVLLPIQDPVEMGMNLDSLISKLKGLDYYPPLFSAAFSNGEINSQNISFALSQFIRSMVSYTSKYDVGRLQVADQTNDFPNFSAEENRGKALFLNPAIGCAACHGTEAFIAPGARNNGLDLYNTADLGVGGVTNNSNAEGLFKVGSLRNVAFTAPYMHDGRFSTLREVIEHYNNGVKNNPNLSIPLRLPNGGVRRLNLSSNDIDALVAFLETLSDPTMLADEKFSDPFN
jgi:cytochrome c peroxidase